MPKRKTDMSIKIDKLTSVYEHEIFRLSDEYISFNNLDDDISVRGKFRDMVNYISERINVDKHSTDLLYHENLFQVFLKLCDKYSYNPSTGLYRMLTGIDKRGLKETIGKDKTELLYNIYNRECAYRVVDSLSNQAGSNRNLQFVASAVYGITEASAALKTDRVKLSQQEIAAQIGVNLTENAENETVKD